MKNRTVYLITIWLFLAFFSHTSCYAQSDISANTPSSSETAVRESTPTISIEKLMLPASPAFTILGVSPSAIERPTTPKAIAASVLSATERSNGDFPQNFALEFSPYWLMSHPNLTYDAYFGLNGKKKPIYENIIQSLAISIGTSTFERTVDDVKIEGTNAGFGIKFMLLRGDPNPEMNRLFKTLHAAQLAVINDDDIFLTPDQTEDGESSVEVPDAKLERVKAAAAAITQSDEKNRVGLMVEAAGGIAVEFPDNDTDDAEINRAGVWITASYASAKAEYQPLTLMAVGRYQWDDREDLGNDTIDIGTRCIWNGKTYPYALSLEYVYRVDDQYDDPETIRGIIEYRLSDDLSLIASYGQDFDDNFEGEGDLIAIFGVKFGYGKGPLVRN